MANGLTKKQQVFVAKYCEKLDGKAAAIKAGYSKKSAESQASQLLKHPKVSEAIAKKLGKTCEELELSSKKVLTGLSQLASYDVRNFFDDSGNCKQIHQLSDAESNAIAGFEVVDISTEKGPKTLLKKFKLADRGQNLERLGRYHKLFTDKIEHSGTIGWADRSDADLEYFSKNGHWPEDK